MELYNIKEEDNMVNIGIIGTNFITDRLIEGAKEVKDAKISAVYSLI